MAELVHLSSLEATYLLEKTAEALEELIVDVKKVFDNEKDQEFLRAKALLVTLGSLSQVQEDVADYTLRIYKLNRRWRNYCNISVDEIYAAPILLIQMACIYKQIEDSGLNLEFSLPYCCAALLVFLVNDLTSLKDISRQDLQSMQGLGVSLTLDSGPEKLPSLFVDGLLLDSSDVWEISKDLIECLNFPEKREVLVNELNALQRTLLPKTLGERRLHLIRAILDEFDSHFDKIVDSSSGKPEEFRIGRIIESLTMGGVDIYSSFGIIDMIRGQLLAEAENGRLTTDFVYQLVRNYLFGNKSLSWGEFVKRSTGIYVVEYSDGRVEILGAGKKHVFLEGLIRAKFRERNRPHFPALVEEIRDRLYMMLPLVAVPDEKVRREVFDSQDSDKGIGHKPELSYKIPIGILESLVNYFVTMSCMPQQHSLYLERIQSCLSGMKSHEESQMENVALALNSTQLYLSALVEYPRSMHESEPTATACLPKIGEQFNMFCLDKGISIEQRTTLESAYKNLHAKYVKQRIQGKCDEETINLTQTLLSRLQEIDVLAAGVSDQGE